MIRFLAEMRYLFFSFLFLMWKGSRDSCSTSGAHKSAAVLLAQKLYAKAFSRPCFFMTCFVVVVSIFQHVDFSKLDLFYSSGIIKTDPEAGIVWLDGIGRPIRDILASRVGDGGIIELAGIGHVMFLAPLQIFSNLI